MKPVGRIIKKMNVLFFLQQHPGRKKEKIIIHNVYVVVDSFSFFLSILLFRVFQAYMVAVIVVAQPLVEKTDNCGTSGVLFDTPFEKVTRDSPLVLRPSCP